MKLTGIVFSGALRGSGMIAKFSPRILHLVGFKPYPGTLDIKLETPIHDISVHATKSIEHVLLDGHTHRDAYLVPVVLEAGEKKMECWAIQFEQNIYKGDVLEVIAKENLHEALGIKDGDRVTVEFLAERKRQAFPRLQKKEKQSV